MAGRVVHGSLSPDLVERRKRVGAFLRKRRLQLGLSQWDICKVLLYKNRNSISNVELGIESLPLKRVYQYADLLQLPRDDFFRFVLGEMKDFAISGYRDLDLKDRRERKLKPSEHDLVVNFRRLSEKYQRRVLDHVAEYLIIEGKQFRRSR